MVDNIIHYFKIWVRLTGMTTQKEFESRFGAVLFIIGKVLRLGFFVVFLVLIGSRTKAIAGYSLWEMIFFYTTFNLVDTSAQFFLREVYRFRYHVISGDFDYILIKPMSSLFRSLFGGSDIFDFIIVVFLCIFLVINISHLGHIATGGILFYALLILNAFIIALSFHVFVLSMGILTTEVDNTIMLFRDLTQMGRFPIDVYQQPIRGLMTFIIPVGIMMTFPAKALLGFLSFPFFAIALLIGFVCLFLSLRAWNFALRQYTSVSS